MTMFSTKYPNNIRTVSGTPTLKNDDVVLECNTALGPVIINLLDIPDDQWNTPWKLYVIDKAPGNAAVNNITINAGAGQKINNAASVVINVTGGGAMIRILDNKNFLAELNYCGCSGGGIAPAYIQTYVQFDGVQTVLTGNPVLWSGFTLKKQIDLIGAGLQDIKILLSGVFEYSYHVTGAFVVPPGPVPANYRAYALFRNAVLLPGSNASNMDSPTSLPANQYGKVTCAGVFSANVNDIIQLRNAGPLSDDIRCAADTPKTGASLKIHRIDDLPPS